MPTHLCDVGQCWLLISVEEVHVNWNKVLQPEGGEGMGGKEGG